MIAFLVRSQEPATVRHGQHHKHRHEEFWDQVSL